jgi:hypothetical protein
LASPDSVEQMARFMCHLKTNLSKEIGRLHDWSGPLFDRRYTMIPISDEEEAQVRRLHYLLSHGCKEGFVRAPHDWPGVHCAEALATGKPLEGIWIDRKRQWVARQGAEAASNRDFSTELTLRLDPIPCWGDLSRDSYQARIGQLIAEIEGEAAARYRRMGTEAPGERRILQCHPHHKPARPKRSPCPRFHAFRRRVRKVLQGALAEFFAAFRLASEEFRAGMSHGTFPGNCFPPQPRPLPP